jgi:hypothetical protein
MWKLSCTIRNIRSILGYCTRYTACVKYWRCVKESCPTRTIKWCWCIFLSKVCVCVINYVVYVVRCKRNVKATKRYTIHRPPCVLTLHLKRFDTYGLKINRKIDYNVCLFANYLLLNSYNLKHVNITGASRPASIPNTDTIIIDKRVSTECTVPSVWCCRTPWWYYT